MYCPFRTKSKTVNFVHANESCTTQGFEHCLGEECAAFYDGICLRMQPRELTIRAKDLTDKELQTLKNELMHGGGQIMPYNPEQESVEITPQWISVSEQLPELGKNVLMYFREGKTFAAGFLSEAKGRSPLWCSFTDNEWFTECDDRPDYWMPLPEPPCTEKKQQSDLHMKKPKVNVGFNAHDCEARYECPYCRHPFGDWDLIHQKEKNGTKGYCPKCGKEFAK